MVAIVHGEDVIELPKITVTKLPIMSVSPPSIRAIRAIQLTRKLTLRAACR